MSNPDLVTYGRAARLRVAVSSLAAVISESAQELVPTYTDRSAGNLVADAACLAADACELLKLAVAYERQRGTSWDEIPEGSDLGTRQAAHDQYGDAVRQLDEAITECWLLGDDPRFPGAPEGLADTADVAVRLDRWVTDHLMDRDPLAHKAVGKAGRVRPVSSHLQPLDALERAELVAAADVLIADRSRQYGPDDPSVRQLEFGLGRRKVELYEHMLANEMADEGTGIPVDRMRELLVEARARLAELKRGGSAERET